MAVSRSAPKNGIGGSGAVAFADAPVHALWKSPFSSTSGCGIHQGNVRVNTWLRSRMLAFAPVVAAATSTTATWEHWALPLLFAMPAWTTAAAGCPDIRESLWCFVVARQCDGCRGSCEPAEASASRPFLGALRDSAGHEYLELHQTDLDAVSSASAARCLCFHRLLCAQLLHEPRGSPSCVFHRHCPGLAGHSRLWTVASSAQGALSGLDVLAQSGNHSCYGVDRRAFRFLAPLPGRAACLVAARACLAAMLESTGALSVLAALPSASMARCPSVLLSALVSMALSGLAAAAACSDVLVVGCHRNGAAAFVGGMPAAGPIWATSCALPSMSCACCQTRHSVATSVTSVPAPWPLTSLCGVVRLATSTSAWLAQKTLQEYLLPSSRR